MTLNGTRYPLATGDLTRTKKGKGKRSAAFIGGGSGIGMLIGGVATGGTGLLIGGLAGAGAHLAGQFVEVVLGVPGEQGIELLPRDELLLVPVQPGQVAAEQVAQRLGKSAAVIVAQASAAVPATGAMTCMIAERLPRKCVR